jgi:hypothetical protein
VSRSRSSGLYQTFRTRVVGRVAAQLCLFLLMTNLLAPLAWSTAQAGGGSDGFALCHAASAATSDRDAPAGHPNNQAIPHCPLCLVFGGNVWAPPSSAPEVLRAARLQDGSRPAAEDDGRPLGDILRLRPGPRAPPASA